MWVPGSWLSKANRAAARLHALQNSFRGYRFTRWLSKSTAACAQKVSRFSMSSCSTRRVAERPLDRFAAGRVKAKRIVYVSCDAMTLGRDLVELRKLGYQPQTVQPIDLMPDRRSQSASRC